MKKHVLGLGLLAAIAVPASANGLYVFGDLGESTYSLKAPNDWTLSKTDVEYGLGIGYTVNQTIALEVGFKDFGDIDVFEDEYYKSHVERSAIQASVLANIPVSSVVNTFGRLGIARTTSDFSYEYYDDTQGSESTSNSKAFFGLGASYAIDPNVSLRLEYDRYASLNDARVSTLTFGATYSF